VIVDRDIKDELEAEADALAPTSADEWAA
jgi:hypothetical protein